eukprot:GFUD01077609.1.p1 GENE.GFUD01077609.1~~GFUD01077609.1.p1  ORF type:complete len:298 (-),score=93.22 GFUD01077609.1:112-1005(-)
MVQLATALLSLWLVSLACTQVVPGVEEWRIVWQEQIDRVIEAERELRQKSMAQPTVKFTVDLTEQTEPEKTKLKLKETTELKADRHLSDSQEINGLELIDEDKKQRINPVTTKPVYSYQKTKSKYLVEAEEFLREFRQRNPNQSMKTNVYETQNPDSQQSIVNGDEENSIYLDETDNLWKNTKPTSKKDREFIQSKPIEDVHKTPHKDDQEAFVNSNEENSIYLDQTDRIWKNIKEPTKSQNTKPISNQNDKVEKVDQNEIKDILIANINTKEGLKEIIKKLLKVKLETLAGKNIAK